MSESKIFDENIHSQVIMEQAKPAVNPTNMWVTKLILATLQIIIAIAIFQVFRDMLFSRAGATGSNIYLVILGCTLATICAYLILVKYQNLIQDFSRENIKLGERLGARTMELEKANQEMSLEIAERRRVEKALLESESRFRTIIREAAIGIAILDRDGRVIEGNPALLSMLGYSADELQGLEFSKINHSENAELSRAIFKELLRGEEDVCRVETRYTRKDGWVGWGRVSLSLVREAGGKPQFVIALFEDITERRESEEKIRTYQEQLQSLTSELSLTEERERRRLATLLHDHIGQLLILAKAKFEQVQETAIFRNLAKPMEEIRRMIEECIRYTRSLIFELSPPILYDLGFEATMDWLAERMEQQYGLKVEVEDDQQPKSLDNEARVLLFRAVRELLFNVLKHAQANRARVSMRRQDGHLQVTVEDDGVGFTPDQLSAAAGKIEGFGLFSIRERLNYFGGKMDIESEPGKFTRVILSLPIKPDKKIRMSPITVPAGKSPALAAPRGATPSPDQSQSPPTCAVN